MGAVESLNERQDNQQQGDSQKPTYEDHADDGILGGELFKLFSSSGRAFEEGEKRRSTFNNQEFLGNSRLWSHQKGTEAQPKTAALRGLTKHGSQCGVGKNSGVAIPPNVLRKGRDVEFEHTDNPHIAEEIAKDHYAEHPKYYDALEKMEARLQRSKDKR